MTDVREQLLSIEQKYKLFKQQQFIFITALDRSREHARDKTEPVSTVTQVMIYSHFTVLWSKILIITQNYTTALTLSF